jgi:hypothetical protein
VNRQRSNNRAAARRVERGGSNRSGGTSSSIYRAPGQARSPEREAEGGTGEAATV